MKVVFKGTEDILTAWLGFLTFMWLNRGSKKGSHYLLNYGPRQPRGSQVRRSIRVTVQRKNDSRSRFVRWEAKGLIRTRG